LTPDSSVLGDREIVVRGTLDERYQKKVLIVGAGIGGLSAAIALCKAEVEVEVDIVEIIPETKVFHVGIVVQVNCICAMAQLGIADAAVAAGFPYKGLRICCGRRLYRAVPATPAPASVHPCGLTEGTDNVPSVPVDHEDSR